MLLAAVVAVIVACSDQSAIGPQRVILVRMVPESVGVAVGDTVRVAAFPIDADSAFLPNKPISWASEGSGTATVDDAGLITGVAAGSTHVMATSGGITGQVIVTVQ